MAVTLDSGLPFHLSRGDQEKETSRLSLRHGRRFNDKRHSWTTDCHPLSSCGINKRRRVSDRTSLSSFFSIFLPLFVLLSDPRHVSKTSSYLFMWQHHCLVIISSPFWTTYPYSRNRIQGKRFDTILLLFPFYFFIFFYGI